MDLELHQSKGSGLDLLLQLPESGLQSMPFILVTTNNVSKLVYQFARQHGADYILCKYQSDYSETTALELLRMLKDTIIAKNGKMTKATTENPQERTQRIRQQIEVELQKLDFNTGRIGYRYLVDTIAFEIEKPQRHLAEQVALKYEKSISSVERAMQSAIARTWGKTDNDTLLEHYHGSIRSARGIPTLGEFVHYYTNKIRKMI